MDVERSSGLMAPVTMAISSMTSGKVTGEPFLLIKTCTLDNGRKISNVAKGPITKPMGLSMRVTGRMACTMGRVLRNGPMGLSTQVARKT